MPSSPKRESAWPHRLAIALVCATFPLVWVGGLVTTYDAGMAVPDWPSTYGYNLFLYPWQTWLLGPWDLFIEHGHRLLGATAGLLTIGLVACVWKCDSRRWMRWLSLAALAAVIGQGVLGGMRVLLDQVQLAKLHACVGPAFFALACAIATLTSRLWRDGAPPQLDASASRLQRLALLTTFFAYLQLVLGAHLRHQPLDAAPLAFRVTVFFHLILAAVVLVHALLVLVRVLRQHSAQRSLSCPAVGITTLVIIQVALGAATWVVKYGAPAWLNSYDWAAGYTVAAQSPLQAFIVTAHVATGSLIVATSLVLGLRSLRLLVSPAKLALAFGPLVAVEAAR